VVLGWLFIKSIFQGILIILISLSIGSLLNLGIVSVKKAAIWRDRLALLAVYSKYFANGNSAGRCSPAQNQTAANETTACPEGRRSAEMPAQIAH
jgi:hypothetical protein